jgi:hypothetical protein
MSAVAMSQVANARRSDRPSEPGGGARSINERAHQMAAPNSPLTDALGAVVAYFPTEINVLYTAILAAIATSDTVALTGQWAAYWFSLAAAPVVVWLLYAARLRADSKRLPLAPKRWPLLEMGFSVVAFAVWGAALPGTPFAENDWYNSALAGVAVLVVTAALGLIAPVLGRTIEVPADSPEPTPAPA